VGFKNHRYFLLFLLYTFCACLTHVLFALPVVFADNFNSRNMPVRFLTTMILTGAISVTLICFNVWSWYLAISDQQFIDLIKRQSRQEEQQAERNIVWTLDLIRARFFHIFGTRSIVRALLPSCRKITVNPFEVSLESTNLLLSYN
jgi:hypothetical protein